MSKLFFLLGYLALMVPTYVLPYLGSNSAVVNGVSAAAGFGPTPMWWAHVWCLTMLVILAYARGVKCNQRFLPLLSLTAGIFDITPVLSMIPFVPTVMHIVTIVFGIKAADSEDESCRSAKKKASIAAVVGSAVAFAGVMSFSLFKPSANPSADHRQVATTNVAKPTAAVEPKVAPAEQANVETKTPPAAKEEAPRAIVKAEPAHAASAPHQAKREVHHHAEQLVQSAPVQSADNQQKNSGTTVRYMKF